jgi:hypothetical protein
MGRLKEALREAWDLARARPAISGQLRAYRVETGRREGARAAISPEGNLGLLVPLTKSERRTIPRSLVRTPGAVLDADLGEYAEGDERHRFLGVWCRASHLNDVFASFGEALLDRWSGGSEGLAAAESCLADFRHLLSGPRSAQKAELVGLVGELMFLARLVERNPEGFDAWCADSTERHDFRRGNCAVEVKTTLRSLTAGQIVHISAIDQLEPPVDGQLYLHLIQLEEVASGPITISGLIAQIASRINAGGLTRLRARVERAGLPADGSYGNAFAVIGRTTYDVRPQFPRLTKSKLVSQQLDVGVRAVQYDLDLAACRSFAVDDDRSIDGLLGSDEHHTRI